MEQHVLQTSRPPSKPIWGVGYMSLRINQEPKRQVKEKQWKMKLDLTKMNWSF